MTRRPDLKGLVERFQLRTGTDESAPVEYRHFAAFVEVPGLIAQGADGPKALAELEALVVPFLERTIEDGADIPVPIVDRMTTLVVGVGPILVGRFEDFTNPHVEAETTDLEHEVGLSRGLRVASH